MTSRLLDQVLEVAGDGFKNLDDLHGVEVVVGVPFWDEEDSLPGVVETARQGIERMNSSVRAAVVCVGSRVGKRALQRVSRQCDLSNGVPVGGFFVTQGFEDRGLGCRVLLEIAAKLKASLVLLAPDLTSQEKGGDRVGLGYGPHWINRMILPVVVHDQDLALARFDQHILAHAVESLLGFPVMTGIFGFGLRQPLSMVCALSYRMVRVCLDDGDTHLHESGLYGFYPWLVVQAVVNELSLCEVPLGTASFQHEFGKLKLIFRQVAHVLFQQVVEHSKWWLDRSGLLTYPRVLGPHVNVAPPPYRLQLRQLVRRFKLEFNHFDDTLFRDIVPEGLRERLESLADRETQEIAISSKEWVKVLQQFLLAFGFNREYHPDDIVDGLYPFFLARLVTLIKEVRQLENRIVSSEESDSDGKHAMVWHSSVGMLTHQANLMDDSRPSFREKWKEREVEAGPYLPRLGAWEFVPNVGVVVPQEIEKPDGGLVWASQIYQEQIDRYREQFVKFVREHLFLSELGDTSEVLRRVRRFMHELNRVLDEGPLPFNLTTLEGANQMARDVFASFAAKNSLQLTPDATQLILQRNPPRNLILQLGTRQLGGLLESLDSNDALAMAAWFDRQDYLDRVLDLIVKDGQPDWFHWSDLKPLVVDSDLLKHDDETRGTTALTRLAGRVVMSNDTRGWGGEFSKLWFFLTLIKRIIGVELFSELWHKFHEEDIDFCQRVVNSIKGHWGRRVLSAHNAFENQHQRILVDRLNHYCESLLLQGPEYTQAAETLKAAAEVYHLSITLPDNTFVPLSAWTWASYNYRGGLGVPTPLSSLVERDWATRDFLVSYLERSGLGDSDTLDQNIQSLMAEGRESEDLGEVLLGMTTDPEQLVVAQTPKGMPRLAVKLIRPISGPILEPIREHAWESRYVLNAAATRLDGNIYIIYRAFGDDSISRLGLAWTRDGVNIEGRLEHPIFEPSVPSEVAGCEDPRITLLDDRLYMLYTAFDGKLSQIALASIPVQAFLDRRFDAWERHGLGFPGLTNKDAVLYPEKFDGRYAIYHRIDPNMWLSYLDDLSCPWPRTGYKIVVGPRPGMMWDGVKIGAGAQPIKTTHGWLNIYHGVDYQRSYRLGVLFMDLDDPTEVLYQSPNPILEPEQDFEIGQHAGGEFWVPRVVFSCGAVPMEDKSIIGPDDEVLVYYGAADTAIGVATGKLRDLVPIIDPATAPTEV